jgi:hypothetical protein
MELANTRWFFCLAVLGIELRALHLLCERFYHTSSCNSPTSTFWVAEITDLHHHTWHTRWFLRRNIQGVRAHTAIAGKDIPGEEPASTPVAMLTCCIWGVARGSWRRDKVVEAVDEEKDPRSIRSPDDVGSPGWCEDLWVLLWEKPEKISWFGGKDTILWSCSHFVNREIRGR